MPPLQSSSSHRLRWAVFISRILTGSVFVISGWAKSIDPYGFMYKLGEYLGAWGISIPREAVLTVCVTLSVAEFVTGALIMLGCLRRVAVWSAIAMLLFLTPLTLYIAVANPVSDCGCFGDLYMLSNWGTFAKNIALCILAGYLAMRNRRLVGLIPPALQWIAISALTAYALFLSFAGYQVQPLMDFRPYTVGTCLFTEPDADNYTEETYIYSRDGISREFTLGNLPDSTWTFVDVVSAASPEDETLNLSARDADGDDVTSELATTEGPALWLVVNDPSIQFLSKVRYVTQLADFCTDNSIAFNALIAGSEGTEEWTELTHPRFDAYSADDTSLKTLVRGDAALVYTRNDTIIWKRTLGSMDSAIPAGVAALDSMPAPDNGRILLSATTVLAIVLGVLCFFGILPKIVKLAISTFLRKKAVTLHSLKEKSNKQQK